MKRTVLAYSLLLVIMIVAMIGVTVRMLALERNEQQQALSAESERLALWRMESHLLPLILEESARNYDALLFQDTSLNSPAPEVQCYFRREAAGDVEVLKVVDDESEHRLPPTNSKKLQQLVTSDIKHPLFITTLAAASANEDAFLATNALNPESQSSHRNQPGEIMPQLTQTARSENEFQSRMTNTMSIQSQFVNQSQRLEGFNFANWNGPHPMTAFWIDQHLYLARTLKSGKLQQIEGCLLDWKQLKPALLDSINDLLPHANLMPLGPEEAGNHLSLATLPVRLIPGEPDLSDLTVSSALKPTLTVAWSCFLLSAAALGVLLFGVVRLSERRAAFVSAVTHELRTPLTTFRLYSDLLTDRESLPEEKYDRYIETLRNEAERLEYLIENVLSWSRLEQSADTHLIEDIDWDDLFDRMKDSLRDRVMQAGMTLELPANEHDPPILIRGNRTAVERILLNLIDNACKYAKQSTDKRIHVDLNQDEQMVGIRVRDYGPGISPKVRSRLFQPFTKSAEEAAKSAPGIGLGLSLSRRLARDMQGDLVLTTSNSQGTTFELRLPRAN